jgi:putative transposase
MIATLDTAAAIVGLAAACAALGIARATYYRLKAPVHGPRRPTPSPRALRPEERQAVLDVLHAPQFVDKAPREVYATLLDQGKYLASVRTMYRVLSAHGEVRERRNQARHPVYARPELLATKPNELWSWDITKLRGPNKGTYFSLYVVIDVFSRYVVGWMIATTESAQLAEQLLRECCARQGVSRDQLTVHADRGSAMTSKPVSLLLADLGVRKSHSRPSVSDDNPYSESQFKTLKYRSDYPDRFGSLQDARAWCEQFMAWYNGEHHHEGIGLMTPYEVHHGLVNERVSQRREVLSAAYARHPERFVKRAPAPPAAPSAVWINKPKDSATQHVPGTCEGDEMRGRGGAVPDGAVASDAH